MENNLISADLDVIFKDLIEKGKVEDEKEVVSGLTLKLRPLNTSELLTAETVYIASNPMMPRDIIQRVRIVSILTHATIAINGAVIEREDLSQEDINKRRDALNKKYMTLSPETIDKAFDFYLEVVKKHNKIYELTQEEIGEVVENF